MGNPSLAVSGPPPVCIDEYQRAVDLLDALKAAPATLDPTALSEFGHLLETFVVGELRKQVSWLDEPSTLGYWRADDDEVDLVVELEDGRVLAFEIKAKPAHRRQRPAWNGQGA